MNHDVIILGSGAAGLTAAVVAAAEGLRVLVLESSAHIGGTTAVSGGMVWIPANLKMAEAGLSDSAEQAARYLQQTVADGRNRELRHAFLKAGPAAVAYLEHRTQVKLRPVKTYPDYYPDCEGATTGGRVLEPVPFDGRVLGPRFNDLRWPLPEFMLFNRMMVDRADIPHFRNVLGSPTSAWRVASIVSRYFLQRISHRRGTRLVLGNALVARLYKSALDLGVTVLRDAPATALELCDGRVTGVAATIAGEHRRLQAGRGVVIATGGFSHHPVLRKQLLPAAALYSAACPSNTGAGIEMALAAGGQLESNAGGNAFWVPASRHTRPDGTPAVYPHTVTDRGKPGIIAVNQAGRRFVNEAVSYHEFVQRMMRAHAESPAIPAYLVCDARFLWRYGLGAIKPFTLSLSSWVKGGYLHKGSTVAELARSIGVDADALSATLRRYNGYAAQGQDPDFGKGGDAYQRHLGDAQNLPNPCIRPIARLPLYAVAIDPADLGTAAGLQTDANARVLDASGTPIDGLYACGNDMASVFNGAYPGPGITLGPALTFGYLAAMHLAGREGSSSTPSEKSNFLSPCI
jgi:succinate dehydrogenase/fumarate reductase flavoprotein subunit